MTPAAWTALHTLNTSLQHVTLRRYDPQLPLLALIFPTKGLPTGMLFQKGPLQWVPISDSTSSKISPFIPNVAKLGMKLRAQCLHT